jgi:hypothetical protein
MFCETPALSLHEEGILDGRRSDAFILSLKLGAFSRHDPW